MDNLNNNIDNNTNKEFHFYDKITLINVDKVFYENESRYSKIIKLFKGWKNKIAIEWYWNWEIVIWADNRIYWSLEKTEWSICKSAIYDFWFWQDNKIEYLFNDQKINEASKTIKEILKIDDDTINFYLNKIINNGRVSYKWLNEEDINTLWWEDNLRKFQAILRSIWWHKEDIMFRIWPVDYYIINNKLKYKVNWSKDININKEHIFSEDINWEKVDFVYVKRDKEWKLNSVWDEKYASDNDFSFWIYIRDFKYDKEKKDYSPYFKKVGLLYKENEKNHLNEDKDQEISQNIPTEDIKQEEKSVETINTTLNTSQEKVEKVNKVEVEEDIESLF